MTVQVLKTKAETALSEAFAGIEPRLPGGEWLAKLRREALGTFAALGLPHRRVEEWKYTDLRQAVKEAYPLADGGRDAAQAMDALARALPGFDRDCAIIVDGRGVHASGAFAASGARSCFLAPQLASPPEWLAAALEASLKRISDGATALNGAYFTDGVVLDVAAGATLDQPLVILNAGSDTPRRATFTRNVIRVGAGTTVTIVELVATPAARQSNMVTQLIIGDGATVVHVKAIETGAEDLHYGRIEVALSANAAYRPFQLTIGAGLVRNEMALAFNGQHSTFDFGAAGLVSGLGHADTTLVIDHKVPHCTSRELVKSVLDDKGRAIFQGKVIVQPGAQKTDGKQMAQALMLSPDAEFDSKPELEIYADDVICGHGSTSAELDEDLLFYLRSRGIPLGEARAMLVESFIGEAIDKVEHEGLRDVLMARARSWLKASHTGG